MDDAVGLGDFEAGQVCLGVVSSVEPFGVFVDVGGVRGLVRVPELSWQRIDATSEVVCEGQEVLVMVLHADLERGQLSLSLKALQDDPLVEVARTLLGKVLTGPVTKVVPIGAFVEVAEGIEGLVPLADFHERRLPVCGRQLRVCLREINLQRRRVGLTLA
ncbi:S1 RNA-binding domain-containing protein [Actinocorallia sp. A-T 12471]|uniref:S1 RNA-binding domain-containing protein n=1 Tax=Actinocorallia sp. A-T 12471 TaxID=3089813 RepID=UPI0029CFF6CD|nr:S1 RNA-binding domain-containing protein [Actinocorallia sp. A-T 12471]MDX6741945.1 S1 RNA-binding domain-containing protein [Actinocorallia sp. A-T 12471]